MATTYGNPGATNPRDAYIAGRTDIPSAGGYKGYNITPGADADIARQIQEIDSMGSGSTADAGTGTGTGITTTGAGTGTGTVVGGTTTTAPDLNSAYSSALNKYLESLTASNDADTTTDKASIAARRQYENIINRSGGTKAGAEASAAVFNRRATSRLADLGIAQDSASRASQVALERLKYEKGLIPDNEAFNLSPGQSRYAYDAASGSYKPVASVPSNEPSGPASVQEYEYAVKNGYKGTFTQYQNEDANRKARAAGGTAADRAAAQRSDINAAINDFRAQMTNRQWAGANPNAYMQYKEYLLKEYGLSAVNELDNAMQSFGIVVDTKNK